MYGLCLFCLVAPLVSDFDPLNNQVDDELTGLSLPQVSAMMAESMYWSADQMLEYQRLQLGQLLKHAQKTTSFYRDRLSAVLNNDGTFNWNNWHKIPILRRSDLQKHRTAMLSDTVPKTHGKVGTSSSSGSTGVPVQINVPQLAIWVASTAWKRFFELHGVSPSSGQTEFKAFLPTGQPMNEKIMVMPAIEHTVKRIWINRNLSAQTKLDFLQSTQSSFLVDTPNHIEVLAHENLRRKNPIRLNTIVGIGMAISAQQELLINKSFRAKTVSPYSSKEGTLMAFQCATERRHFHVCSELVFFEVVNDRGLPVSAGQPGRVVVTPFFNSAQPLIRYEQGDLVVRGTACICGTTLPVLSEICGRSDAIFHFPEKQIAITRLDDDLIQQALAADAYQFAQTAPLHIVVRYVSNIEADDPSKDLVKKHLLSIVQTYVQIKFERLETIPFNSGGKQQRITREF